jgi:hypothetical protein
MVIAANKYKPEYDSDYGHPFNVGTKGGRQRAVKAAQQEAQANGLLFFEAVPNEYDYGIVITSRGGYSKVFGGNFNVDTEYGEDGTVRHTLKIYEDGDVHTDTRESEPNQSLELFLRQHREEGNAGMLESRQIVTKSRIAAIVEKNSRIAEFKPEAYRPIYDRKRGHPFDFANEGVSGALRSAESEGIANGLFYKGEGFHVQDRGITVSFRGCRNEHYSYNVASSYNEDGTVGHYISISGENGVALFEERHSRPNQDLKSFLRETLGDIDKKVEALLDEIDEESEFSGETTMSDYVGIAGSFS